MEVLKLDIVGSYLYKPDIKIASYDGKKTCIECIICKRFLSEPSYEIISNNKNITMENNIVIGKCGHMFHNECLSEYLKNSECCPIDNVKWCLHRVADTTTKLVVYNQSNKYNLKRKYNID